MITAVEIVPGALAGRRRSVPQGNGSALLRVAKSNTLPYDVTFVDVCRRKNQQPFCVRTFMKRPVKLPVQFERSTSLSDTLPVSARRL